MRKGYHPSHESGPRDHARAYGARTDLEFWLGRQPDQVRLAAGGHKPLWYDAVAPFMPKGGHARCLEIGVVPGSTLLFLATKHGFSCTGVDLSPRVHDLRKAFAEHGLDGRFICEDVFAWHPPDRFDVVYSTGFIEHFDDYERVVELHWDLVEPGGLLIIAVPTLTPVQWLVRKLAYTGAKWNEMVTVHNLRIMSLSALRRVMNNLPSVSLLRSTYTGGAHIWFGPDSEGVRPRMRRLFPAIRWMERRIARRNWSSRLYSPIAVVALRKDVNHR